jgi:uracil-DNA glycosylase
MVNNNRLTKHALTTQISQLPSAWTSVLGSSSVANALTHITTYVEARLDQDAVVYPATPFRALHALTPSDIRVVILGQDPYHGAGQAQGLAFSVAEECKRPPSLRNIFNEIAAEYPGTVEHPSNDLTPWAEQGVLLLNTSLTVEDGLPASHAKQGWEIVTDAIIRAVANDPSPKAFLLWGAHAQAKQALIPQDSHHLILTANHPSPLSARRPPLPFLGCGHFKAVNEWLTDQGKSPIDWSTKKRQEAVQQLEFKL